MSSEDDQMASKGAAVSRKRKEKLSLQESIQACREAGKSGGFEEIVAIVDAVPLLDRSWHQNQNLQTVETSIQSQLMTLLGHKGYALMKLDKFSEALPFLEESQNTRNRLEQETAEDDVIRSILQRPIVRREATAVDQAAQTCHGQALTSAVPSSIVTGVTPVTLMEKWGGMHEPVEVIGFYQDRKSNPWREFSNFYQQKGCHFDFVLPPELLDIAGVSTNRREELFPAAVRCEFSEKAIMLCKAAVMGDGVRYGEIAASDTPQRAKRLGRMVSPWYENRWQRVVCGVAVAVLRYKFAVPSLRKKLLGTGDKVLCEATVNDTTWAIGISVKMTQIYNVPARWKGSNILGWALMEVRREIRQNVEGIE